MSNKNLVFSKLSDAWDLGVLQSVRPITGGTLHNTWKLTTSKGVYALRELNIPLLSLQNKTINFLNQAEQVAAIMQTNGISTVVALQQQGNYVLLMDNRHFMLFPWVEGKCVAEHDINNQHAADIGRLLAKMHALQLDPMDIELFCWQAFSAAHWQNLFAQAKNNKYAWYAQIAHALPDVIAWSPLAEQALLMLKKNRLLSHRDLNSLNVIWCDSNLPVIIDWEFAGYINPTLELFIVAINWSRLGTNHIEQGRYQKVLQAYRSYTQSEHKITPTIMHGYLGYCMDWFEFNLRRALAWPEDVIAVQEMVITYKVIKHVAEQANVLLNWSEGGLVT